ncbi:zinc-ribbon domain-containing protein [Pseudodesulfovibrio piezophilus]|uniref:Zinc-ribbon domain-containing protein n=1 Tax=Pseudodesulfovibrio piezophilus (strain DSM 21447 / JCM 15486 / C1TLV30) TaxID=1322246 RepID=M1WVN5_PSEP2|nr:zinc-ribbon domain-containing protein [Pseudodesulfovibrio piezophilus]CCH48628.1 conserved protein of unknown function [Pseudodesulfovibrio piezophilus C1TLV30]
MIICTGCGRKNDDETRYCEQCGKKLQSSYQSPTFEPRTDSRLTRFTHQGMPPDKWESFRKLIEAWCYLLLLLLVGIGSLTYEVWWPLYPTVVGIGLLLYFRRI